MKNVIKKAFAFLAFAIIISCSKDEVTPHKDEVTPTFGTLAIEFDHGYNGNQLFLGTTNTPIFNLPNSNKESLSVVMLKYIVSNVVLTKTDGTTFAYPKGQSYFIIDAVASKIPTVNLKNIPVGDYTKIKFGIGVDKQQYNLGLDGQGDFWTNAAAAEMTWSWSAGYKFLMFEGNFKSELLPNEKNTFKFHTGMSGQDENYIQVTLDLPTKALVRNNISPDIHLKVDAAQIIDGKNKIRLFDTAKMTQAPEGNNPNVGIFASGAMSGAMLATITENLSAMFKVDHVHNNSK